MPINEIIIITLKSINNWSKMAFATVLHHLNEMKNKVSFPLSHKNMVRARFTAAGIVWVAGQIRGTGGK